MRETRATPSRPRPVIVRFLNFRDRLKIFKSKRKLRGSNISISENLTQKRYVLCKMCMDKLGKGAVWTNEGRITTKIDNKYKIINNKNDLACL